jgi:hypothetical protein
VSNKPPIAPIAVGMSDAVRLTGVSRARIYEWMGAGLITPRYNGSRLLFIVSELTAVVERLPRGVQPTGPLLPPEDRAHVRERVGEPDFTAIFTECFERLAPSQGANEARRRALADTIRAYRKFHDCDYKPTSIAVRALIPPASPAFIDPQQLAVESESLNYASIHADESPPPARASLDPRPAELASVSSWRAKI